MDEGLIYGLEESTSIEEQAKRLAERIRRTGVVRIGRETFRVESVTLFRETGIVSGWSIAIDGDRDTYRAIVYDRGERTYARIHLTKPGIVVAVGEEATGKAWASIIYKAV